MQEINLDTLEKLIIEQGILACKAYENDCSDSYLVKTE